MAFGIGVGVVGLSGRQPQCRTVQNIMTAAFAMQVWDGLMSMRNTNSNCKQLRKSDYLFTKLKV